MNKMAFGLAGLLVLGGCNMPSEADRLEEVVGEELAKQGNVVEVSFEPQGENEMTGFARLTDAQGVEKRMNCTANRTGESSFDWRCTQTIDEALLTEMEGNIRAELVNRGGEVVEVDLQRGRNDHNMVGHAVVRDGQGEVRVPCVAVRDRPGETMFSWRCGQGVEEWADAHPTNAGEGGAAEAGDK